MSRVLLRIGTVHKGAHAPGALVGQDDLVNEGRLVVLSSDVCRQSNPCAKPLPTLCLLTLVGLVVVGFWLLSRRRVLVCW
jgi:hypothetical protein